MTGTLHILLSLSSVDLKKDTGHVEAVVQEDQLLDLVHTVSFIPENVD
jgi:hypothetical protein